MSEHTDPPQVGVETSAAAPNLTGNVAGNVAERPEPVPPVEEIEEDIPETNGGGERDSVIETHNAQLAQQNLKQEEKQRLEDIAKAKRDLEALSPETEAVRWVIGKPPEHGGKERQYAIYVQEKLPWMPRQKFFGLVTRTLAQAVRAGGGSIGSMAEIFNDDEGGNFIDRGKRWTQRDFGDLGSFVTTLLELIGYSPDFMEKSYLIWLNVPRHDIDWAKERFNEPWKPEENRWGLKDEDHEKMINTFIDQNYEELRAFLLEKFPAMLKRAALHERSKERTPIMPQGQESL